MVCADGEIFILKSFVWLKSLHFFKFITLKAIRQSMSCQKIYGLGNHNDLRTHFLRSLKAKTDELLK